jgi:hypothetical protein
MGNFNGYNNKSNKGTSIIIAVVAILVVAGAIFWLAGPKIFGEGSVTGAVVASGVEPEDNSLVVSSSRGNNEEFNIGATASTNGVENDVTALNTNGIYTELSLNNIPTIKKEVTVNYLDLKFTDLSTQIKVNTEYLELNYLKNVDLKVSNFVGKIAVDGNTVSLDGTASKIKVNDITVSNNLKLTFSNLNYDSLVAEGIAVEGVSSARGSGSLDVKNGKLKLAINNDPLVLGSLTGNIALDKASSVPVSVKGYVQEVSVGGELPFVLK